MQYKQPVNISMQLTLSHDEHLQPAYANRVCY